MPLVEDCSSTAAVPRYRQASRVTSRHDDAILASESGTFSSLPTKNASRKRVRSTSIVLANDLSQSRDSAWVLRALPSNVNQKWLSFLTIVALTMSGSRNGPLEVMSFDVIVSKLACSSRRRTAEPARVPDWIAEIGSRRTTPLPRHRCLRVHFWSGFASPRRMWPFSPSIRRWDNAPRGSKRLLTGASSSAVFARIIMLFTCDSREASNACVSEILRALRSLS